MELRRLLLTHSVQEKVSGIGAGSENYLTFDSVEIDEAGTYTCIISYKADQVYEGVISVNGITDIECLFSQTGDATDNILIPVDLVEGINNIKISNDTLQMADIDCISIISGSNSALPLPTPTPTIIGDVNEDGQRNIIDSLLVAQDYVGLEFNIGC